MPHTVLGINLSHTGAACLLVDGRIRAAVAEERLSRIKGDAGFPWRSIEFVLRDAGIERGEVDALAVGTLCERFVPTLAQSAEYRPSIRAVAQASRWVPLSLLGSGSVRRTYRAALGALRRAETRRDHLPWLAELGIRPKRVLHLEHHECHAAAAYHLRPFAGGAVVLTCDGLGDGLAATVALGSGATLRRIASTSSVHSLGSMYSRVTRALGFKPWEHEGKVMGLAPYADRDRAADLAGDFERFLELRGLEFRNRQGLIGDAFLQHVSRRYGTRRFDDLAHAIQHLAELRVREWAENAVRSTGVRRVCAAGGVFLNVKANAALADSPWIDEVFFFPAPGDESVAIGAALLAHQKLVSSRPERETLGSTYWGPDAERGLDRLLESVAGGRYEITRHGAGIAAQVAGLLAEGEIVARVSGRLEFGPRALGNRSLLADPSRLEVVGELNRAVKNRDHWMPFAPAILEEHAGRYLHNPKGLDSPHMMLSFGTRPDARQEIAAALHPADFSARPQIVHAASNPGFHHLLREFQRLRGIGALLNTSFNLHGKPMVGSAADALEVLDRSRLRHLVIGDTLFTRRGGTDRRSADREPVLDQVVG